MFGSAVQPGLLIKKPAPSDIKEFHDFRWYLATKSFEQLFQIRICVFLTKIYLKNPIFLGKRWLKFERLTYSNRLLSFSSLVHSKLTLQIRSTIVELTVISIFSWAAPAVVLSCIMQKQVVNNLSQVVAQRDKSVICGTTAKLNALKQKKEQGYLYMLVERPIHPSSLRLFFFRPGV